MQDSTALYELLATQDSSGAFLQIYVLDPTQDGVVQISQVLAGYSDVDAVHVLSHASGSGLKLGDSWLKPETLDAYANDIAGWGKSLNEAADLLFYGCELAGSEPGQWLLQSFSTLTGADVAASQT